MAAHAYSEQLTHSLGYEVPLLAQLPLEPELRETGEAGRPAVLTKEGALRSDGIGETFKNLAESLMRLLNKITIRLERSSKTTHRNATQPRNTESVMRQNRRKSWVLCNIRRRHGGRMAEREATASTV